MYWTPVLKIHVQNVQLYKLKFWFSILKFLDLHDIFPFLYNFAHRFRFRFYTVTQFLIIQKYVYTIKSEKNNYKKRDIYNIRYDYLIFENIKSSKSI